jgi:hypothetical protein
MKFFKFSFILLALASITSFSWISDDEVFLSLIPNAKYVLRVQISGKEQVSQWTAGFTDYQAHGGVIYDYKKNFDSLTIIFNHRANGVNIEASKVNQLVLGEEYIILLDGKFTEISSFEVKDGVLTQMIQKVYLLIDSYTGVKKYSVTLDNSIKAQLAK